MRLLFISQDFPPETGGIQTYSRAHADRLSRYCDWFGVVCPRKKGDEEVDRDLPYPVFRLRTRNELLDWALRFRLNRIVKHYRVDVTLHAQWQTTPSALRLKSSGWKGSVTSAAHGRELYFNPWSSLPFMSHHFEKARNRTLNRVDHFFPVSDYTGSRLIELGVDEARIDVVKNGTDPARFYPDRTRSLREEFGLEKHRILLTVTRLVERKGVDLVLRAVASLKESLEDIHYLIVGDGPDRERLESLVKSLGIRNFVTFAGRRPHEELNRLYNSADLFVMPSRTSLPDVEGFGIVFLEASSAGLPVIGSDSGGIPSAIKHGETGWIVPEGDRELLASQIYNMLSDPEKAAGMGRAGREYVLKSANWNERSRELFQYLKARTGAFRR